MIHMNNSHLANALEAAIEDVFGSAFAGKSDVNDGTITIRRAAALLGISFLLNRIQIKTSTQSLSDLIGELRGEEVPHSVFVEEHRKIVGVMIQEMFAPTGAKRFVMIGVTDENKCIVIPVQSISNKIMEMDEVVVAFQHCIDAYKTGESDTIEI